MKEEQTILAARHFSGAQAARPQKITFAEMRAAGVRDVLIYCSDYTCSHWTRLDGCHWADDVRLSDIDGAFVCTACERRGADVRLDWQTAVRRAKGRCGMRMLEEEQ